MSTQEEKSAKHETEPQVMRLGELLILASLWMLFGFMLWFYMSAFHGIPVRLVVDQLLGWVLGDAFSNVIPNPDKFYLLQVQTAIPFRFPDGSTDNLGFIVNPLVYGYGLPLLFGLVMGANQTLKHKLGVMLVGYGVILLVQIWGVFWECLKSLSFNFGETAHQAVVASGVPDSVIALCYQLGSLILPGLAPVIVWVLGNWKEVEKFIEHR